MAKPPPKPDPTDPDNKGWGGGSDEGQCKRCGGSGDEPGSRGSGDCRGCGGSGQQ